MHYSLTLCINFSDFQELMWDNKAFLILIRHDIRIFEDVARSSIRRPVNNDFYYLNLKNLSECELTHLQTYFSALIDNADDGHDVDTFDEDDDECFYYDHGVDMPAILPASMMSFGSDSGLPEMDWIDRHQQKKPAAHLPSRSQEAVRPLKSENVSRVSCEIFNDLRFFGKPVATDAGGGRVYVGDPDLAEALGRIVSIAKRMY